MPITLYHTILSQTSRGALMVARVLGVDVDIKLIDLVKEDHRKPEYLKVNPEHTVPALDDNGFVIWDSQVISKYLADTYGKDDSLYPRDPKKRARVDQRLFFNATTLLLRQKAICNPVFFLGSTGATEAQKTEVIESLGYLEEYLAPSGWVAGKGFSIADCLCVATVSTCPALGFDISNYKNINAWLDRCRSRIPDYDEVNQKGTIAFKDAYMKKLQQNKA